MRSIAFSLMLSPLSWRGGAANALALPGVGAVSTCVWRSDLAGVRRCGSLHPRISFSSRMSCHLTPARKLFGSWAAATGVESTTDGKGPTRATCEDTAALEADASLTTVQLSALRRELQQLRQQVSDLKEALEDSQEAVKQLLIFSASQAQQSACRAAASAQESSPTATPAAASAPSLNYRQHLQGACYVVRTSEELTDALRGHGSEHASRTVLLDGKLFVLNPYAPVVVDRARVSILGNNATIIGQIAVKGRGALLSVSDAFLLELGGMQLRSATVGGGDGVLAAEAAAPLATNLTEGKEKNAAAILMPVVSATVGASLHLNRCTLSSGRDGVYLGMGSHCTLNHVRIVNCVRGLYEGVGCRALILSACTFQSNRYHIVLLGPNKSERAARMFHGASGADASAAAAAAAAASSSSSGIDAVGAASSVAFTSAASVADVLARGITNDGPIAIQQTKAQVVLQHCPITDTYEDCWCDGVRLELSAQDATAGLSDPLF
ncbi:hypothetical protein LSCM4_05572 [Leishmania orientalis]|uniref:Right handed beta helix domain-containing protein n=1 Tax=Leishmania orientalis TaxID=2249476 RepID=A0A836H048_9TRYP|nr:hypothetical protein LSCM4_05572 [Leishmania orientalis]